MTLRIFETDQAKYYLGLGNHTISSAPLFEKVDFSTLDFMVFESGDASSSNELHALIEYFPQYSELYHRITSESNNISLYGLDTLPENLTLYVMAEDLPSALLTFIGARRMVKKQNTRRDILTGAGLLAAGFLFSSIPGMINLPGGKEINSIRTNILPLPIVGFRDALAAKKITEYLVPKHQQEGRKIQAAILYGGDHSGIEAKLKYPWLYEATLNLYHNKMGYKSAEELNQIMEVAKKDDKLTLNQYSCGLF